MDIILTLSALFKAFKSINPLLRASVISIKDLPDRLWRDSSCLLRLTTVPAQKIARSFRLALLPLLFSSRLLHLAHIVSLSSALRQHCAWLAPTAHGCALMPETPTETVRFTYSLFLMPCVALCATLNYAHNTYDA